jgi:YD repeat-containing protein
MRALARALTAFAVLVGLALLTNGATAHPSRPLKPIFTHHDAAHLPALGEQPALRTRTSRTFAATDGSYSTRLYDHAVNYRSGKGWRPIDNTLQPTHSPGYALENGANSYSLRLPHSLDGAPVRIENGSRWLTFSLTGARGAATLTSKAATATYAEALPGVDVAYTAAGDSVKEALTLSGPGAATSYQFRVETSPGLAAKASRGGGISFVDRNGAQHFSFAPPFMRDAAGASSTDVSLDAVKDSGGYTVTLKADAGWLRSPTRRYPVVIDPTTRVVGNGEDCYLVGGSVASTHFCGFAANTLDVGNGGGPTGQDPRRAYLKFDTSAVPKEATVLYAELGLYNDDGSARTVNVNRLTRSSTPSRTWNTYDGTNAWTTPGGDISSTPDASTSAGGSAGWYKWYPSDLAQGWVNGSIPNYGMLLSSPTTLTNDVLHFRATEQVGFEPYLTVRWEYSTGVLDGYGFETDQVSPNLVQKVNVAAGNLILDQTDLSLPADGMDFDFHRYFNGCDIWTFELGQGWKTNTDDIFIGQYGDTDANGAYRRVVLWLPSFTPLPFERQSDGSYRPPRGFDGKLVRNSDGSKTVTWYDEGITWNFSSGGTLRSEATPDGKQLTFTYDARSNLASITDTTGAITRFTYTANDMLQTMTDPTGKVTTYGYYNDASGNPRLPSTVTDSAGKVTRYAYDGADNLTQLTGPDGSIRKYTYGAGSKIASSTQVTDPVAGTGPKTTFTYGSGFTTVTRPDGSTKKYTYYTDLFLNRTDAGTSPPTVTLSGTLPAMEDKTLSDTATYTFNVAATDPGSGLKSVEILVDDQQEDFATQACTTGGCSMSRSYTFDGSDFEPGESLVKVIATSQNGAETMRQFRVTVPGDPSTMPASDETVDSAPELADDTAVRPNPPEGSEPDDAAVDAAKATAGPLGQAQSLPTGTALFNSLNAEGARPTAAPGDPVGAIGLDRYIEMVNRTVNMYDRTALGTPLRSRHLSEWMGVSNAFDPQILWDQRQQRYFYAADYISASGGKGLAFGWSTGAHPADLSRTYWCKMVSHTSSALDDFPKFAVGRDWMIVGSNVFNPNYVRSRIRVAKMPKKGDTTCPKSRELHLKTFNVNVQNPGATNATSAYTPVPVRTFSTTNRGGHVIAADHRSFGTNQFGGTRLLFWRVVTKKGKPRLRSGLAKTLTVPDFSVPPSAPQNGSLPIDTDNAKLYQAFGDVDPSNGKFEIWTAHTIAAGNLSGVRWYEASPPGTGSAALKQSATIDATSEAPGTQTYLFYPTIAPAANGGDAFINYNVSRPDLPVVIHARARHGSDAANQFGPAFAIPTPASTTSLRTAGDGCYQSSRSGAECRWGDYGSTLPDPNNPNVVWGTDEWVGPDGTYRSENFALRPNP